MPLAPHWVPLVRFNEVHLLKPAKYIITTHAEGVCVLIQCLGSESHVCVCVIRWTYISPISGEFASSWQKVESTKLRTAINKKTIEYYINSTASNLETNMDICDVKYIHVYVNYM